MTKGRRAVLILAPVLVLVLAACGHDAPANQPRLADLNVEAFKDQFNRASDRVRIILLLSPT